jgi:hypothetical protein
MKDIPLEMQPDYIPPKIIKENIFIEFSLADYDFIKKMPKFINIWDYKNVNEMISRREMGCIETEKAFIRFLGNDMYIK